MDFESRSNVPALGTSNREHLLGPTDGAVVRGPYGFGGPANLDTERREMLNRASSEAERWDAVMARSEGADGRFYYAVRTTGVFCRPHCPSRRPRPENVEFFETVEAAQSAGYRPCKRCRPDDSPPEAAVRKVLVEACRLLSAEGRARSKDVARTVGLSESYFQRCFKKHLGVTPQQYRRRVLAERGRAALRARPSVTESVYAAGYSSSSRFYEGVGKELGMQPSVARRGGVGERVDFAVSHCSLGAILIAWTSRGVCEVAFADRNEELELVTRLESHFPKAELVRSKDTRWVEAVIDAVELDSRADIPVDVRGTAFQERVWHALRGIPVGETRTYSEIADALGDPAAVRAVARACAENRIAVLVPCHRVVRKDGALAGYRWGVDRKRELLEREQGAASEARLGRK